MVNQALKMKIAYCPMKKKKGNTWDWAVSYGSDNYPSTLEGIVLWNNQPDREAFGLVRKGVGQSTVLRAVETPYPKVSPIQSNPMSVQSKPTVKSK